MSINCRSISFDSFESNWAQWRRREQYFTVNRLLSANRRSSNTGCGEKRRRNNILLFVVILIFFLVVDVEVAQLIASLGVGDDAQPIAKVVLLKVLLRQVLEVPATAHFFLVKESSRPQLDALRGPQFDPFIKSISDSSSLYCGYVIILPMKKMRKPSLRERKITSWRGEFRSWRWACSWPIRRKRDHPGCRPCCSPWCAASRTSPTRNRRQFRERFAKTDTVREGNPTVFPFEWEPHGLWG